MQTLGYAESQLLDSFSDSLLSSLSSSSSPFTLPLSSVVSLLSEATFSVLIVQP